MPLVSRHTLAGDALPGANRQGVLATTRYFLTAFVQAMGQPEIREVWVDGAVANPGLWRRTWAEENEVPIAEGFIVVLGALGV